MAINLDVWRSIKPGFDGLITNYEYHFSDSKSHENLQNRGIIVILRRTQ